MDDGRDEVHGAFGGGMNKCGSKYQIKSRGKVRIIWI